MGVRDLFRTLLVPAEMSAAHRAPLPSPAARPSPSGAGRALAGGRLSLDTANTFLGGLPIILPPPDVESTWRIDSLDDQTLTRISPFRLIQYLADLSPDVSRALWDFLRLCNPGWEAVALRPSTNEQDTRGQAALDAFLGTLADRYGSVDVPIGRLFIAAYVRGGFLAELVLDEAGRTPLDLVTPDPASIRFELHHDPVLGQYWRLGQWQMRAFVPMDRPTIRYVPVDPMPGSPYGRAPAAPALFPTLFLLGLFHDLRRVVAQQGYPRLDLSIDLERIMTTAPSMVKSDPEALRDWVNEIVSEVQKVYATLKPDDAYIHTDVVTVNRPVGTVDAQSLGAIDGLVELLERMSVRALKSMPLMFGTTDGVSEANANRQYEIHVAGIKALQHLCESLLERLLGLALQAQGIQADVRFRFAELRAAELLRDAQAEAVQIDNAVKKYLYGWISQDEAAHAVTGHPADAPAPRALPAGDALTGVPTNPAGANPEPGAGRGRGRGMREPFTPVGAGLPLPAVPDRVSFTADEQRRLVALWNANIDAEYRGMLDARVTE